MKMGEGMMHPRTFHVLVKDGDKGVCSIRYDQDESIGHHDCTKRIHRDEHRMPANQHRLLFVGIELKIQSAKISEPQSTYNAVVYRS